MSGIYGTQALLLALGGTIADFEAVIAGSTVTHEEEIIDSLPCLLISPGPAEPIDFQPRGGWNERQEWYATVCAKMVTGDDPTETVESESETLVRRVIATFHGHRFDGSGHKDRLKYASREAPIEHLGYIEIPITFTATVKIDLE